MNIKFLTQATVVEEKSNTVDTVFVNRFINGKKITSYKGILHFDTRPNL